MRVCDILVGQILLLPLLYGPLLVALVNYVTSHSDIDPLLLCQDMISNFINIVFVTRFCRRPSKTLKLSESALLILMLAGASYILHPIVYGGLGALDMAATLFALQLVLSGLVVFSWPLTNADCDIADANNLLIQAFIGHSFSYMYLPTGWPILSDNENTTYSLLLIATWGWTLSSCILKLNLVWQCAMHEYSLCVATSGDVGKDNEKAQVTVEYTSNPAPRSVLEDGLRYVLALAMIGASYYELMPVLEKVL